MAKSKGPRPESRRNFMRQSLRRLAKFGATLGQPDAPEVPVGRDRPQPPPRRPPQPIWLNRSPRMSYSRLGETRLMASRIVLNCAATGREGGDRILKAADRGVNLFLSAPNWGASEVAIGTVYEKIRNRAWIASMTRPFEPTEATEASEYDADAAMQFWDDLESSLGVLRAETIDCYFLQGIDRPWRVQDAALLEAMDRAKEQSRVRHLGLMSYRNTEAVVEAALERDIFDLIMIPLNPLNLASTGRLLDRARAKGVGVIGLMPTIGIDDTMESGIVPLFELPGDMTPREIIHQYMFKNATPAVLAHDFIDEATLERDLDLAIFEPGVIELNEIDTVVEEELWPACGACGQHRTIATADLEQAYVARLRRTETGGAGDPSDSESAPPGEFLCEKCRSEVDAAAEEIELTDDSEDAAGDASGDDPPEE